jgi:hypothetical protein
MLSLSLCRACLMLSPSPSVHLFSLPPPRHLIFLPSTLYKAFVVVVGTYLNRSWRGISVFTPENFPICVLKCGWRESLLALRLPYLTKIIL